MPVFIIDTSNIGLQLQGALIGVEGSSNPTAAEKQECLETIRRYVFDGWAIAADAPALSAETACVPFVNLTRIALHEPTPRAAQI